MACNECPICLIIAAIVMSDSARQSSYLLASFSYSFVLLSLQCSAEFFLHKIDHRLLRDSWVSGLIYLSNC